MATSHINIGEAKTHLSQLLQRVAAGEEIIIARANKPIARLVPIAGAKAPRQPGRLLGQIVIRDDFDQPLPELEEAFHDGSIEP